GAPASAAPELPRQDVAHEPAQALRPPDPALGHARAGTPDRRRRAGDAAPDRGRGARSRAARLGSRRLAGSHPSARPALPAPPPGSPGARPPRGAPDPPPPP